MTDADNHAREWMSRRTVLKSGAVAGALGLGLTGTASADGWQELTVCAAGDETFSYRIEVTDEVKRGGTYQSDDHDTVGDDYVEGAVAEERCDSFLFKGEISDSELDGPGQVKVDGEVVEETADDDDSDDKDDGDSDDEKGEHELTFCSADDGTFEYRAEVTGEVTRGGTYESDDHDTVGDDYVEGAAAEGRCDSFLFTGELDDLALSGPGVVRVDGDVVEDTTDDDDDGLDQVAVVSSPDTDDYNDYVFEVTGDLEYPGADEDSGRAADEVIRSGDRVRVEGTVSYGEDRYLFSGDLIEVDVPDAVEIDISDR